MENQTEKAYLKQKGVCANPHLNPSKQGASTRYYKNVGLGFRTPKEASEGKYVDKKCPFTSKTSIRGKVIRGIVVSTKMKNSIAIRRDYLHYIKKYNRFEKRHKMVTVHASPAFIIKAGDIVTCGQCRPISKTIRFNVLQVGKQKVVGSIKKQFLLF